MMDIEDDLEALVREALRRSVSEEAQKFEDAVDRLAIDPVLGARGLSLVLAIDLLALRIIHDGQVPDDDQLRYLAQEFATTQGWSLVDEETALGLLTALSMRDPDPDSLTRGGLFVAAFAVGGWLLSAFKVGDGEGLDWNEFLDLIEAELEAAPE